MTDRAPRTDPVAGALDTAMDRTIVLGNSRIGYELRRRNWSSIPSMDGRVALVTGASSGLGKATAAGLARLGVRVHLLGRSRERGEAARAEIEGRVPDADLAVEECDVSRLGSVRSFVSDFRARQPHLDLLVHNAGGMPWQRETTEDGNELTFATHVLGPFLLTSLLVEPLRAAAPGRVLWISSSGMYGQRLDTTDLQYDQSAYRAVTAYAHTKRMQVIMAEQWAQQLAGGGIVVHSAHPGWVDTPGLQRGLPRFHQITRPLLRTPAQGADTFVWLGAAAEPAGTTGLFWHDRAPRPTHYLPLTRETPTERGRLWRACVQLSGHLAGR